jgi:hypothetical protein
MKIVEQVNIVVPNMPSSLAKVSDRMRAAEVNIEAITCTEGPTHTIIHLIVNDAETAKLVLKEMGSVSSREVIAIRIRNTPGAIAQIARACAAADINIRMIYSTAAGKESLVYLSIENVTKAIELLRQWEKTAGQLGID